MPSRPSAGPNPSITAALGRELVRHAGLLGCLPSEFDEMASFDRTTVVRGRMAPGVFYAAVMTATATEQLMLLVLADHGEGEPKGPPMSVNSPTRSHAWGNTIVSVALATASVRRTNCSRARAWRLPAPTVPVAAARSVVVQGATHAPPSAAVGIDRHASRPF